MVTVLHNWLDAYQPIDLCRRPATPIGVTLTGFAAADSDIYIRSTFPVGIKVVGAGTEKDEARMVGASGGAAVHVGIQGKAMY